MPLKIILRGGQKDSMFRRHGKQCLLEKHNCCRLQFSVTAIDGSKSALHADNTIVLDRELSLVNEQYL